METEVGRLLRDPENAKIFQQERLILEATSRICERMNERNVSKSRLAALLRTSKGYISQLLGGEQNMTLRKLSDVFFALGMTVHIVAREYVERASTLRIDHNVDWKWSQRWPGESHPGSGVGSVGEEEGIAA